jgi:hypothetical protein
MAFLESGCVMIWPVRHTCAWTQAGNGHATPRVASARLHVAAQHSIRETHSARLRCLEAGWSSSCFWGSGHASQSASPGQQIAKWNRARDRVAEPPAQSFQDFAKPIPPCSSTSPSRTVDLGQRISAPSPKTARSSNGGMRGKGPSPGINLDSRSVSKMLLAKMFQHKRFGRGRR